MARNRKFQNNFSGGVLAPSVYGRTDIPQYGDGMSVGRNIVVEAPGGVKRRPGSLFIREYPDVDFVRLFPFRFNTEQEYLIVLYPDALDPTASFIDIYRNNVLLTQITAPWGTDDIDDIDYAQSADTMVMSHGDYETRILRRLGTDEDWELVLLPFVTPPPEWTGTNGYPKFCTFHQGRLWFACSNTQPQSVWGSVAQDFFNFDPGTGDPAESIHEILDTDQINPIVAIYSERNLQVFTTGSEFINSASVITPTTSAWKRQSGYGSYGSVQPVSINGGVLFLDRTGRTIRNFLFTDSEDGYTSESLSLLAEHLVVYPQAMGVLRGRTLEASSFVFVVNQTGTMAVLNLMKSVDMVAWTEWVTQGNYKDVLTLGEDTFILVERQGTWILEQLSDVMATDSGSYSESLVDISTGPVRSDINNYFGVNYDREGRGQVVVVWDGEVVYKRDDFKANPFGPARVIDHIYIPFRQFSSDEGERENHFPDIPFTTFAMYSIRETTFLDEGKDFIDGLPHLIGRRVSMVLDGSVFPDEVVVAGDELPGGGFIKTYPDGSDWKYDIDDTHLYQKFLNGRLVETHARYDSSYYGGIIEDEYGYKISDLNYLEKGTLRNREEIEVDSGETTWGTPGTYSWTAPDGVTQINMCMAGGGGSGACGPSSYGVIGGGNAGSIVTQAFSVTSGSNYAITIGSGGARVAQYNSGNPGTESRFSTRTANGGAGGILSGGYRGQGASRSTCYGAYNDGNVNNFDGALVYGGQAGLGDGGEGLIYQGGHGLRGSGGGAGYGSFGVWSGLGGDGFLRISWQSNSYGTEDKFETRLMVLEVVDVPATDGVVKTPRPYNSGQAGLWFGVEIETMPISIGTSVNEPKRIVSVTSNYRRSAGIVVENVPINTKYLEREMLDTSAHLETGTKKIRVLGYNTKTTVQIKQDVPLPMTLLSLDMEIKY